MNGYTSCLTYHYNPARNGWFLRSREPTSGSGKYMHVDLGGAVRGAPLYLATGTLPSQKTDLLIVTTSNNNVAVFTEEHLLGGSSTPVRQIGPPLGKANPRGGSNIPPPVGICSTPVIDSATGHLYVLALQDDNAYWFVSLDAQSLMPVSAAVRLSDNGGPGRPTFDGSKQDQRGGLNLVGGLVYATFADFLADDEDLFNASQRLGFEFEESDFVWEVAAKLRKTSEE